MTGAAFLGGPFSLGYVKTRWTYNPNKSCKNLTQRRKDAKRRRKSAIKTTSKTIKSHPLRHSWPFLASLRWSFDSRSCCFWGAIVRARLYHRGSEYTEKTKLRHWWPRFPLCLSGFVVIDRFVPIEELDRHELCKSTKMSSFFYPLE